MFVGSVVGVLSAYLKSGLDFAWGRATRRASRWSEAHRKRTWQLMDEMSGNPQRQILAALQAQRMRQESFESLFGAAIGSVGLALPFLSARIIGGVWFVLQIVNAARSRMAAAQIQTVLNNVLRDEQVVAISTLPPPQTPSESGSAIPAPATEKGSTAARPSMTPQRLARCPPHLRLEAPRPTGRLGPRARSGTLKAWASLKDCDMARGAGRSHTEAAMMTHRRPVSRIPASICLPLTLLPYNGSSLPACSATMYSAYQSGQFASRCPVRLSCSPCAASARLSVWDRSLTDA